MPPRTPKEQEEARRGILAERARTQGQTPKPAPKPKKSEMVWLLIGLIVLAIVLYALFTFPDWYPLLVR